MTRRLSALTLALCLVTLGLARQESSPSLPAWVVDRLSELRPERPMDYFELGEEVSYEITEHTGQELARTLFVLAYQINADLGPHACLALADLTTSADDRRWLLAMAESMGARDTDANAVRSASRAHEDLRRRLADGIRSLRAEDGRAIREAIAGPTAVGYLAQLQQSEPVIYSAVVKASQLAAGKTGCPRCRNQRVIAAGSGGAAAGSGLGGGRQHTICPRCGGNPGMALSETEILDSLRVEANLRRVEPSTWSAIVLLHKDRPLRDIRAGDLARTYAVDGAKTLWSRGLGWHAPTNQPASAQGD